MIMQTAYLNNYYAYNTPTEDLVGTQSNILKTAEVCMRIADHVIFFNP